MIESEQILIINMKAAAEGTNLVSESWIIVCMTFIAEVLTIPTECFTYKPAINVSCLYPDQFFVK